jgi:Anti-sigma-K factor rskA
VLRRFRGLSALVALTASAYVAHRVRSNRRPGPGVEPRSSPAESTTPDPSTPTSPSGASEAPAEAVVKVATMEVTPVPPVSSVGANGAGTNGAHLSPADASAAGSNGSPAPSVGAVKRVTTAIKPKDPVVLPRPRKPSGPFLAALAALFGVAGIALSTAAFATSVRSNDADSRAAADARTISLLAKPSTERVPVASSGGRIILAVGSEGRAVLVLRGLGAAPADRAYQAWVTQPGAKAPASAAVFSGEETFVRLAIPLRPGAVVSITVERKGGVAAPTRTPSLVATTS